MPFERPTLSALLKQARADMREATGGKALLRASPLAVMTKVLAGLVHGLYGYIDYLAEQITPATATGVYLVAWGALVGVTRKGEATATATATFSGTVGRVLAEGSRVSRAADGVSYLTTALGTVGSGGTVTVPIAAESTGAIGNALAGAEVVIAGAADGINAVGALTTAAAGGADQESEDDFRDRVLLRYREPPQGGAAGDYARWAVEVPGVTRAWDSSPGPGVVVVHVMLDEARASDGGFPQGSDGVSASDPRGIAATGDQLLVADYVRPLQPVTALVYVVAPDPYEVDLTIGDLSADSTAIRATIAEALRGMFRRKGSPGGELFLSDFTAAVDGVAGVNRFSLTVDTALPPPAGALPVLGTITWA